MTKGETIVQYIKASALGFIAIELGYIIYLLKEVLNKL